MNQADVATRDAPRPSRFSRRLAWLLALCVVGVFAFPIGVIVALGPSVSFSVAPRSSNTVAKRQRAELTRQYALPADQSIDPMRAGEAFHSLGVRSGYKLPAGSRPATHGPFDFPAADTALFRGSGPHAWAGPSVQHIIELARKGFSPAEMEYLGALARNPVWQEYAIVAQAPRMDLAGAAYQLPFPLSASPYELQMTRFAATKEVAYASTARAAWHLASKRPAQAEMALRETISNGFRLIDDGNSLMDELIGIVVVGIGRTGLEQLYEATGNAELPRMRAATAEFDRSHPPAASPAISGSATLEQALVDSTRSRGLRFELATSSGMSACASLRTLMFGPPATLTTALATARRQLARTEGEGAIFDLDSQALERLPQSMRAEARQGIGPGALAWSAKVSAFLLRNPRIENCAVVIVASLR